MLVADVSRVLIQSTASKTCRPSLATGMALMRTVSTTVGAAVTAGRRTTESSRRHRTKAYIYAGPGASTKGVNSIMSILQESSILTATNNNNNDDNTTAFKLTGIQTLGLQDIDSHDAASRHWTEDGAVLIMPGGESYTHYLKPNDIDRIRDFVFQGGSYLGMCAGAYFGATRCFFEGKEVASPRQRLRLIPGDAVGSITPQPYDLLSERGAASVQIVCSPTFVHRNKAMGEPTPDHKPLYVSFDPVPAFSPTTLNVYANGGCYFVHHPINNGSNSSISNDNDNKNERPPNCQVLATYGDDQGLRHDAEGQAAIVTCHYGEGKVVLSGVHPEFTAQDAQSGAQACHCINGASSLQEEDDRYRAALFRSLLREVLD